MDEIADPSSIAHYRITAKIGKGGMGEVYRATDTKLGRQVAIKVLPEAFAQVPDRLTRFAREARVLASLNHPNIAAIYGVEERALIMELVEGPTLAEQIAQGAVPLDEALAIAREMTEALEYAHESRRGPSGSEAGEHQGCARRTREGSGLRPRQGDGERTRLRRSHLFCHRHGGAHRPRAGPGDRRTTAERPV